jgi:hypothetical protein
MKIEEKRFLGKRAQKAFRKRVSALGSKRAG